MLLSWFSGYTLVACQVCLQPVAQAFLTLTSQHPHTDCGFAL